MSVLPPGCSGTFEATKVSPTIAATTPFAAIPELFGPENVPETVTESLAITAPGAGLVTVTEAPFVVTVIATGAEVAVTPRPSVARAVML